MHIVVTGCSGHLGQVVVAHLLSGMPGCRITGLDIQRPACQHERFHYRPLNIADPGLTRYLQNVDAIIHLAFIVIASPAGYDPQDMNVQAARNLVSCVQANSVPVLIHLSSAAVYGPWPDMPVPVTEQADIRPLPGFAYAQDKVAVEQILMNAFQNMPQQRLVILRPPTILGPGAQPFLKDMLTSPFRLAGQRGQARSQCVHELDVAEAIQRCLMQPVAGVFNLAATPARSYNEWQQRVGGGRWPLPWWLAAAGLAWNWRRAGGAGAPAWLHGLGHDLVLDCTALYDALGWQPQQRV